MATLAIGPFLGFGLVGLLLAASTIATGANAYSHGERSWMLWIGMAFAAGAVCYLPFMSSEYPYTNQ
ncbi:MAG TPA: hypothetical protein VFH50_07180 [Acidimicrobiales bacterium]|nr:hypothetical protein [Acidimicrobiales bacterium]